MCDGHQKRSKKDYLWSDVTIDADAETNSNRFGAVKRPKSTSRPYPF